MMEYKVETKWAGWLGGWGSESDVAAILNREAKEGWRLARIDSKRALWWWLPFMPRIKLLMVFERTIA